jgi:hexosaminidase
LIYLNLRQVQLERYNLQVYLSIAQLFRQNLQMILEMQRISDSLKTAAMHAGVAECAEAVGALDQALDLAGNIREQRNQALQDASDTWYERWFPRVSEANGRPFLDKVDDVKDHLPVRTVDLSYLVYRELLYPLNDWAEQTLAARNQYAKAHHLPARSFHLEWHNTAPGVTN